MNRKISQSKIVNISSSSAVNYNNGSMLSDVAFYIPNMINKDDSMEDMYISITHCEIPNSFYLINQYNNILNVNGVNYTVPTGNYNRNTLATTLVSLLGNTYSITFNTMTSIYTITNSVSDFTISASLSSISRIMGLSKTSNMTSTSKSLTLPYPVNMMPTARLNIRCANLCLDNYHSNDGSNDILLSLQNNAGQNQMILYENSSNLSYYLGEIKNLNILNIRITDDSNRTIDFNNSAWFITLKIDYTYLVPIIQTNFSKLIENNNSEIVTELLNKLK